MSETHVYDEIFLQLDNPLRFRLTRNKKTDFFIAKIKATKI